MKLRVPIAFLLGASLYLAKLPYLLGAWKSSPMDRPDRFIFIAASLTGVLALFAAMRRRITPLHDSQSIAATWWRIVPALFPRLAAALAAASSLAAFAYALAIGVNALEIVAAILFNASLVAAVCGFDAAVALSPAFFMFSLAVPSSTYWLGTYFGVDAASVTIGKYALAAAAALLEVKLARSDPVKPLLPRRAVVAAAAAAAVLAAGVALKMRIEGEAIADGAAFRPDFSAVGAVNGSGASATGPGTSAAGAFLSREVEPDAAFKRFFHTSEAKQWIFADRERVINVLEVRLGKDIHEIHPSTHCLRSTGWRVVSECTREETLNTHRLALAEAYVTRGSESAVNWTWYSDASIETPSFVRFRSRAATGDWRIYQIRVSAAEGVEKARAALREFLSLF